MREYIVEHTSIESQLTFDRMLPSLPGPGTPAFATLVKALHPFGISPSGVTVDAPSSILGDVVLVISLLEKRVAVRITAASLELLVSGLIVGDESGLVTIVDSILEALRTVDSEFLPGNVTHRIASHLRLQGTEIDEFLMEHQVPSVAAVGLVADAIAYKVSPREGIHAPEIRFVLAKSVVHKNALFINLNSTYSEVPDTATLAEWMESDFDVTLGLLGLIEAVDTND